MDSGLAALRRPGMTGEGGLLPYATFAIAYAIFGSSSPLA
jgi:hypothetical protein